MEKDRLDQTGDVYQNITISGGTVGAIGGRGHHIEQGQAPTREAGSGLPAAQDSGRPAPTSAAGLVAVRDLLLAAFTAVDLRRLFEYSSHLELRPAAQEFAEGDGLAAMVDKAIQFCQTRDLLPDLLAEVERLRPRPYARYKDRLPGQEPGHAASGSRGSSS